MITLNANGLNALTKRHRPAEWIQKQEPYIRCLQETHFKSRNTYRMKVREWKKVFHANGNQKKAGVAMLISHIQYRSTSIYKENINRLNQEETENMNRPITINEIETVIKIQKSRTRWLHREILSNI